MSFTRRITHMVLQRLLCFEPRTIKHRHLTKKFRAWFHSYLQIREETVNVGLAASECKTVPFGEPQGSMLGSLFYALYA